MFKKNYVNLPSKRTKQKNLNPQQWYLGSLLLGVELIYVEAVLCLHFLFLLVMHKLLGLAVHNHRRFEPLVEVGEFPGNHLHAARSCDQLAQLHTLEKNSEAVLHTAVRHRKIFLCNIIGKERNYRTLFSYNTLFSPSITTKCQFLSLACYGFGWWGGGVQLTVNSYPPSSINGEAKRLSTNCDKKIQAVSLSHVITN
jgi:hypothetical protein